MNCKQGDLAVMVRSDYEENVGALFEVLEYSPWRGHDWKCTNITRAMTAEGWQKPGAVNWAIDADLRPIRDPGDDAVDETLLWVPSPAKEIA